MGNKNFPPPLPRANWLKTKSRGKAGAATASSPSSRTSSSSSSSSKRSPSSRCKGKATAASARAGTVHHVVQHLRADAHPTGAHGESTGRAGAKHLARVDQVLAAVVAGALLRVAQGFVGLADFLEVVGRGGVIRVLVRVVHNGEFAVGFLDVRVGGVLVDAEDLVKVFALALFELELGVADVFRDPWFLRVRFRDAFQLPDRCFPVARFAQSFSPRFPRFEIAGFEVEGASAVGDGGFVVFEL